MEIPNYDQNSTLETTGETHKLKENQLKCDPYIGCIHFKWEQLIYLWQGLTLKQILGNKYQNIKKWMKWTDF